MTNKQKIIKALENNEIVAIPTDTVYGLFIKLSEESMFKLNLYKKRNKTQPLQVMFPNVEAALPIIEVNEFQESILREELPGSKSIVVPTNKEFATKYLNEQETISLRIPSRLKARDLIEILEAVGPCFATSANTHGAKMANDFASVMHEFTDILVLEGKPGSNLASTIIELNANSIKVLRKGKD